MAPTNINTLVLLGDVYSAKGMTKEAAKNYRIAMNLNKDLKRKELIKNKIAEVTKNFYK